MRMCQQCGAGVPNDAGFCGECGQLVTIDKPIVQEQTLWMSHTASPPVQVVYPEQTTIIPETEDGREQTILALENKETRKYPTAPIADRHLPPGGGLTTLPLVLPDPERVFTDPLTNRPLHLQGPGRPSHVVNKPQSKQIPGWMIWLLAAIIVPLIILGSIIGIGFTFLAPTLTLDGNTSVATGNVLHLHGGHFIPGNSVTCVLDGSIPLSYSNLPYPISRAAITVGGLLPAQLSSATQQTQNRTGTNTDTTITVGSDGTFSVTFVVGQDWKVGQHTIRATEAFSPRSATTTFTVTGNGQTVRTATSTATVSATKTIPVSPTTVSATKPGLSAITPNRITFGPLSIGYTQTTSTQVLLNTTGTAKLDWTATWDTTQAPWLRLNAQSGQIQEPATQTLIISTVVGSLKAGTYNATILFRSNGQNGQNLSLPVSLTIQTGCIKANPVTLNFMGIIEGNDPASQIVALNNCGALGSWTEATPGSSWLLISPTGGNLNHGATQNIIVSASLANLKSGTGTYHGQIIFTNGPAHAIVNVIFTVKTAPLPTLGSNTTSLNLPQCKLLLTGYKCSTIILHSSGTARNNLNWTATSSGIVNIATIPQSGTLRPGQTAAIEIDIAHIVCKGSMAIGTVTFSGPANSIMVTVNC